MYENTFTCMKNYPIFFTKLSLSSGFVLSMCFCVCKYTLSSLVPKNKTKKRLLLFK